MNVETETYLTLREHILATLKLFYKRPLAIVLQIFGFVCLPFVTLAGLHLINIESRALFFSLIYFAFFSILCPLYVVYFARKQYKSSVAASHPIFYIFDDSKVSYKAGGMDGHFEWKYILKYTVIKKVLALYMTSRGVIFIKIDKLTDEQINFILSKINDSKI